MCWTRFLQNMFPVLTKLWYSERAAAALKEAHCAIAHKECGQLAEVSEVSERLAGVRTLRLLEIESRYRVRSAASNKSGTVFAGDSHTLGRQWLSDFTYNRLRPSPKIPS